MSVYLDILILTFILLRLLSIEGAVAEPTTPKTLLAPRSAFSIVVGDTVSVNYLRARNGPFSIAGGRSGPLEPLLICSQWGNLPL